MNEKVKAIVRAACKLARCIDSLDCEGEKQAEQEIVDAVKDGLAECAEAIVDL